MLELLDLSDRKLKILLTWFPISQCIMLSREHTRLKGKGHFMVLISLPEIGQDTCLSIQKGRKPSCLPFLGRAHSDYLQICA